MTEEEIRALLKQLLAENASEREGDGSSGAADSGVLEAIRELREEAKASAQRWEALQQEQAARQEGQAQQQKQQQSKDSGESTAMTPRESQLQAKLEDIEQKLQAAAQREEQALTKQRNDRLDRDLRAMLSDAGMTGENLNNAYYRIKHDQTKYEYDLQEDRPVLTFVDKYGNRKPFNLEDAKDQIVKMPEFKALLPSTVPPKTGPSTRTATGGFQAGGDSGASDASKLGSEVSYADAVKTLELLD